ncbi:unnamed protein product [Paramecium sonneborni]|uniref:MORN repeat protein n=1 Tax=Paramecium sonneborni TaxID=65129 RepID=A0A8S1MJH0_9CILI|nr:unnamed protein product [Paramecium sonneborni]
MLQLGIQEKDGFVREETQNGFAEGNYKLGVKTGKWVLTYPDRIEEGNFQGKNRIGQWLIHYSKSDFYEAGLYDEKNLKTGEWITFKEQNSEVTIKTTYQRGVKIKEKKVDQLQISTIQLKKG